MDLCVESLGIKVLVETLITSDENLLLFVKKFGDFVGNFVNFVGNILRNLNSCDKFCQLS